MLAQPGPEPLGPLAAVVVDATVPDEELAEPVPRRGEVLADVVPRPNQVTHRLLVLRRHGDGGELAGPVEPGQLAGVPPVGLDPIARLHRDERRRDDLAGDAHVVSCRNSSKPHGPAS